VSAARDQVVARVREATGGSASPGAVERTYRTAGTLDGPARLVLLEKRLVDYRARVERTTESMLASVVEELAGGGRIGIPPGIPGAWRPANAVEDDGLTAHELDGLDGVLTGCTVAVAETGTLVLAGGPTEGRRALTLVPDLHLCVVRTGQIVETVPEAFAVLRGLERRPLTFVSGPSATSDIELKRVEGVHGPRTLVVLIVEDGRTGPDFTLTD
jgi:L-lactate dehydrogenase complex protein LldG